MLFAVIIIRFDRNLATIMVKSPFGTITLSNNGNLSTMKTTFITFTLGNTSNVQSVLRLLSMIVTAQSQAISLNQCVYFYFTFVH